MDFDELARAALQDPAAFDAYWRAVFALESWHYIARDDWAAVDRGEKALDPTPFIGVLEGGPHLLAFTSGDRAGAYARTNGLTTPDGNAMVITMSPSSSVQGAESLGAQGVAGVVFNISDVGILCPVAQLAPMLAHYTGEQLDRLADAARASGDVSDYFAAVFGLENWHFLVGGTQEDGMPIPFISDIGEVNHVFVFTSSDRARSFAAEVTPDEPAKVMQLPIGTAVSIVKQM